MAPTTESTRLYGRFDPRSTAISSSITRSVIALSLLVSVSSGMLGIALITSSPAQEATDGQCVDDRISFDNDDDAPRIRADLPEFFEQRLELPFAEPPGRYEILVSTFEIFSREGQEREQVNVIINGQTFGSTPDLPGETDGVLEELTDISLGFISVDSPIDAVTVRHAFAGEDGIGPESIRLRGVTLVCTPDEPSSDDTPENSETTASTSPLDLDDLPIITGESIPTIPTTVATEPDTTVPGVTVPGVTVPETEETVPETTILKETEETVTVPETVVPETVVPEVTIPDQNSTTGTIAVTVTETGTVSPSTSTPSTPSTTPATVTSVPTTASITEAPVEPAAAPPISEPLLVEGNQLPRTGSQSGVLAMSSLMLLIFGAMTMMASRRLTPKQSKLSKGYLASLDKVFTAAPEDDSAGAHTSG